MLISMDLFNTIQLFCTHHNLLPQNATIIVGLSGGPDSVFLLHFLLHVQQKYALTLIAAHLDHQWRQNSDQDRILCQELCQSLNIPFVYRQLDELPPLSKKYNGSQEEVARNKRRQFFAQLQKEYNADLVALGHHADDQQETFFIRLLRGTTIDGLCAMAPQEKSSIRPLLATYKSQILEYLHNNQIAYAIDQTNNSDQFLRNRIRNHVIPSLRACDNRFDNNFQSALSSLQESDTFIAQLATQAFAQMTSNTAATLALEPFFAQHPLLQNRILLLWLCTHQVPFVPTQGFFNEIMRFLKQPGNKEHTVNCQWKIKKYKGVASICFLSP
jgi:tRNA(Ile)-lysidine synthase